MKTKITPHTVFIYSWGNFLRVVRGEHAPPDVQTKPRVYASIAEALESERRPRIVEALQRFPTDKHLDKRLKALKAPVKVAQHRTLAEAIRSDLFIYAQAGYDLDGREIAHVYHRCPENHTGIERARSGPILAVRKLLKKYRKEKAMREHNYREPKRSSKEKVA